MTKALAALRYGLVSLFCAGLYIATMIAGDRLGLHYVVSYLIAFVLVVSAGFLLHAYVTLKAPATWPSLVRYTGAMALNAPLNLLLIAVLTDGAKLPMTIAAPATTILLIVWNLFATQWALRARLFRAKGSAPDPLETKP